jgi:hypothetical protein
MVWPNLGAKNNRKVMNYKVAQNLKVNDISVFTVCFDS